MSGYVTAGKTGLGSIPECQLLAKKPADAAGHVWDRASAPLMAADGWIGE